MKRHIVPVLLLLLAWCAACGTTPPATSRPSPTATTRPPTREAVTDVDRGEILFRTMQPAAGFACLTCHYIHTESRLIGPGLLNVGTRAESYGLGQSAEEYLRDSILNPNAFIAPANPPFTAGVMPHNYANIFSDEQLSDLIAYLLSL